MGGFIDTILGSVPHWVVYAVVFALPFLEAAVLLGFVLPGETAVIFGGVLAGEGRLSLVLVLALAIAGAILGDSVGYAVGHHFGRRMQVSRLGRVVGDARWDRSAEFLQRRGPAAVFAGRFSALLRAMVPGAAGMARMPYPRFLFWNVAGGTLWAAACVLGSWAVGSVISTYISDVGYVLLGAVALAVVVHVLRSRRRRRAGAATGAGAASEPGTSPVDPSVTGR